MIVSARKDAGLTQRDVAARLKRQPSYIGKLEKLERRIDLLELVDILEAIEVKSPAFISEFLGEIKKRR